MTTTMRAGAQTLTRIQNLARLYRSGYHSSTVDTTALCRAMTFRSEQGARRAKATVPIDPFRKPAA
jgi:hypothetical protein